MAMDHDKAHLRSSQMLGASVSVGGEYRSRTGDLLTASQTL